MERPDYQDIITEYKESVRVLRAQISELEDSNKSKDSALKRALQKLEFITSDLDKANQEINAKKSVVKKTE
jgi:hypothetical protein